MNINLNETTTARNTPPAYNDDPNFDSIDGPNTGLPSFVLSMLKIGQIITAKEASVGEITAVIAINNNIGTYWR